MRATVANRLALAKRVSQSARMKEIGCSAVGTLRNPSPGGRLDTRYYKLEIIGSPAQWGRTIDRTGVAPRATPSSNGKIVRGMLIDGGIDGFQSASGASAERV